jgi:hypothetical protein
MDDKQMKQGSFNKTLIAALPLVLLASVAASGDDLVELNEVSIDYKDYFAGGYDPLITGNGIGDRGLGKGIELNVNTDVLSVFFFNNRVHTMTDEITSGNGAGQFRTVGWQFQLGLRVSKMFPLDIYYEHHSQHLLDTPGVQHFPVNDSVGLKLTLFSKRRREALIPW